MYHRAGGQDSSGNCCPERHRSDIEGVALGVCGLRLPELKSGQVARCLVLLMVKLMLMLVMK